MACYAADHIVSFILSHSSYEDKSWCNSVSTCEAVWVVDTDTTSVPKVHVSRKMPYTPCEHTLLIIVLLSLEVWSVVEEPGVLLYIPVIVHINDDPDSTVSSLLYSMPNLSM